MNYRVINLSLLGKSRLKLLSLIIFFLIIGKFSVKAEYTCSFTFQEDRVEETDKKVFEITSAFIATWQVKEIRDYAVLEVLETNDFVLAYKITEELRKIVNEPILVKHGFEDGHIVYQITIGRFDDIDQAQKYHSQLK